MVERHQRKNRRQNGKTTIKKQVARAHLDLLYLFHCPYLIQLAQRCHFTSSSFKTTLSLGQFSTYLSETEELTST